MEFLLTSHPLDCPICDKGGECPLQNLTMGYGPGKSRFLFDEKMHLAKHVPAGRADLPRPERCIQCARCIRFQDEIADDPVLGFYERGRAHADRHALRAGLRFDLLGQHHRHLPGGRADHGGLPLRARAPGS